MTARRLHDLVTWARGYEGDSEPVSSFAGVRRAIAARRRRTRLLRMTLAAAAVLLLIATGVVVNRHALASDGMLSLTQARGVIDGELHAVDAALADVNAALDGAPDNEMLRRRHAHLTALRADTELSARSLLRRAITANE